MKETDILVLRDNAKAELMQIKSVEDGMTHLNKLKTIETWVKAEKKDAELQNIVAEQKLRTQRILGELIKESQRNGELATEGSFNGNQFVGGHTDVPPKTLNDLGLTKNQSSAFQKIASIPEDQFEAFIHEKKQAVNDAVSELTTRGALRLAGMYHQTYSEELRAVGYFNGMYARKMKAYKYNKNMEMSDIVVLMCRTFLDSLPESESSQMMAVYLRDLKMGEVK